MKKLQLKKEVVERLNDDQRNSVNGGGWNTLGSMLESCKGWPCYPGDGGGKKPILQPEEPPFRVTLYFTCACHEAVTGGACEVIVDPK